jgi:hypothetical protein
MAVTLKSLTTPGKDYGKFSKASVGVLKELLVQEMGFSKDDLQGLTKSKIMDIINDFGGGFNKGGMIDYRKTGLFK